MSKPLRVTAAIAPVLARGIAALVCTSLVGRVVGGGQGDGSRRAGVGAPRGGAGRIFFRESRYRRLWT